MTVDGFFAGVLGLGRVMGGVGNALSFAEAAAPERRLGYGGDNILMVRTSASPLWAPLPVTGTVRSELQVWAHLFEIADDDVPAFVQHLARLPTHFVDQAGAAAIHAEALVRAVDDGPHIVDEHVLAVRAGLLQRWKTAGWRRCPHLTNPQPAFIAISAPEEGVFCARCGPEHRSLDPIEEFTCDLCRRYRPSGLRNGFLTLGALITVAGICPSCADRLDDLDASPARREEV
jgi:hypothetical protein